MSADGRAAVMRALAEGRIRWAFWPPEDGSERIEASGIWIDEGRAKDGSSHEWNEEALSDEEEESEGDSASGSKSESEASEQEDEAPTTSGAFAAERYSVLVQEGGEEDAEGK